MVKIVPKAHKGPHRHPNYKTAYRVRNWAEYDKAWCDRGDITLWISQDAIDAWTPSQTGKRGAQPLYSDLAIETALSLRLFFSWPLHQTEGFLCSLLRLTDLRLSCPDHTTLCGHPKAPLRRLSSSSHAAPRSAWLQAAPAGHVGAGGAGGVAQKVL
jgi:hypothetical protein